MVVSGDGDLLSQHFVVPHTVQGVKSDCYWGSELSLQFHEHRSVGFLLLKDRVKPRAEALLISFNNDKRNPTACVNILC